MMEQKEVEDRIKHISHNLDFWVYNYKRIIEDGFSKERIDIQIDKLLDELIVLLKLKK